jgi:hypothetical protein
MNEKIIEDIKLVYPEFKFWKDLYTTLNKSSEIIIASVPGRQDTVQIIFSTEGKYYYLEGYLHGETEFIKWINEIQGVTTIKMDTLKLISKTLKKNCVKIKYNDVMFQYSYLINDNEKMDTYLWNHSGSTTIKDILNKSINLNAWLNYTYQIDDKSIFKDDIFEVFIDDNNKLTTEKNS